MKEINKSSVSRVLVLLIALTYWKLQDKTELLKK